VGLDVYPEPPAVTVIPVTPTFSVAAHVAPLPEPPVNAQAGVEVKWLPPLCSVRVIVPVDPTAALQVAPEPPPPVNAQDGGDAVV